MTSAKILLFTLSPHGQANCHLAAAHELMQQGGEVHLASLKSREKTTAEASKISLQSAPNGTPPIQFHKVHGANADFDEEGIPFPEFMTSGRLTFWAALRNIHWAARNMTALWPEDNFFDIYYHCARIIAEVSPDVVVVDLLFGPAIAASQHSERKYHVLSPMALKEFFLVAQPHLKGLLLLPSTARSIKSRTKRETGHEMITLGDMLLQRPYGVKVFASSLPELDFQPFYIPPDIIPCGPILRPTVPVVDVDPELARWLSQGPTISVNLGTFYEWSEQLATEMARSLKVAFQATSEEDKIKNLQILWKLKKHPEAEFSVTARSRVRDILSHEISLGRVKIEEWLTTSPHSILETGHVIVSVN